MCHLLAWCLSLVHTLPLFSFGLTRAAIEIHE